MHTFKKDIKNVNFNFKNFYCYSCYYYYWNELIHSISFGGDGGLVAKLYWTLCNPMDCSFPGSSVPGIS